MPIRSVLRRGRPAVLQAAKLLLAGALLWLLFGRDALDWAPLGRGLTEPGLLLTAALLLLGTIPLGAIKWQVLLRSQGVRISGYRLFRILWVATFFNNFLLGGASGDAMKAVYLAQAAPESRARALLTILVDRACGMLGLLLVALGVLLLKLDTVLVSEVFRWLAVATIGTAIGLALAFVIAVSAVDHLRRGGLGPWLERAGPAGRVLWGALVALGDYREVRGALAMSVFVSTGLQALPVLALVVLGGALRIGDVDALGIATAAPFAVLTNMLPLTPGGLGVGEAAFSELALKLSPSGQLAAYGTLFLMLRLLTILVSLPGALYWVTYRNESPEKIDLGHGDATRLAPVDRAAADVDF